MDAILLAGALAIAAIAVWGFFALRREKVDEDKARDDYQRTLEKGAQPPSLHPRIDLDKCIGCGACVKACPESDVLAVLDAKARVINPTACIGHGECGRACPTDAIRLVLGTETRGIDIPLVQGDFQTDVPGLYVVGELGGMGLIYNAMTQGLQCVRGIAKSPPTRLEGVHQLIVVGAGPAGLASSLAAIEAKLDFVVVDQESIGGTVLQFPRQKIVMTRPVALPLYGPVKVSSIQKEALLEIWNDVIAKTGLEVKTGVRVDGVKRRDDGVFEVLTSTGAILGQRVVLAIGRRGSPRKLEVPGESLPKVTYRLLEPEHYAGKRVLVVGGGDSAIEASIALGAAGADTTLAYRGKVFDRIKPKNQERLDGAVATKAVTVLLETQPKAIRESSVLVETRGQQSEIQNDFVLVLIGGTLPTAFLEKAGVTIRTFKGEELRS